MKRQMSQGVSGIGYANNSDAHWASCSNEVMDDELVEWIRSAAVPIIAEHSLF